MFPFASAGGRQLRRTKRLETKTGTTSRGAEGRTLELGTATEEGEEAVRGAGAMEGRVREGKADPLANTEGNIHTGSTRRRKETGESKEKGNGIRGILNFLGGYKRVAD